MKFETLPKAVPGQEPSDEMIDLGQLLKVLSAGWRTLLGALVAACSAGLAYLFLLATPIYSAKTVVMLEIRAAQVVDLQSVVGGMSGETSEINSEIEVFSSRGLAAKVVDKLDLTNDPEFNPTLLPPSPIARLTGWLRPAPPQPSAEAIRDKVITAFGEHLSIRNIPSSYVFEISVTSIDPEKAARIADEVAQTYILNQIEVKFEATEYATNWLTARVGELKQDLETAEEKVKIFNAQTTLVSSDALTSMEIQIKDLRERRAQTQRAAEAAQARLAALEEAGAPTIPRDARLRAATDTELDRIAARIDAGDAVPQDFELRYAQIETRARLELTRLREQVAALDASAAALEEQISKQGDDMIQLQQLTREADASRLLYEYFLSRLKETSAQQGIQQADSRILSEAVPPGSAASPRKVMVLALCAMLGLLAGSSWVLLRALNNSAFRTARALEEETGIAVVGQIPVIPAKTRRGVLDYLLANPSSAAMEAIRNLRTSVLLSNVDRAPQVILVTSSVPGEGKTTNAIAIAHNLAATGKSVLLMEGDIRRNTMGEYFRERTGGPGLISLLAGKAKLEDALTFDESCGVWLLMGERSRINAADVFESTAYARFIEALRSRFDYVVIDTPPVLIVPEARIIAQTADAVLFTVRWNVTPRSLVDESLRMFSSVNRKVTGLILSQIDTAEMERYGYGGKYGRYGAYGTYGKGYYHEG